jgi:hypothetical protein
MGKRPGRVWSIFHRVVQRFSWNFFALMGFARCSAPKGNEFGKCYLFCGICKTNRSHIGQNLIEALFDFLLAIYENFIKINY